MIKTHAPGKLFVAGEYSVVEPGYPAILAAVDRYIDISLERCENWGSISSDRNGSMLWCRGRDTIAAFDTDNGLPHIACAVNTAETYAKEQGRELDYYCISVTSQLQNVKGEKYGLGSSGAVTVATIKVLCEYYDLSLSREELFKLCCMSQFPISINSSFGDIAASVYGGWIAYTSFDREWVLKQRRHRSITEMLKIPWRGLSVKSLLPPGRLKLVIGWTGIPASTLDLVATVYSRKDQYAGYYEDFLQKSRECVTRIVGAFETGNIEGILGGIGINRHLLLKMSGVLGVEIETPLLAKLCDIAVKSGGSAKPSGAGGGDCGIVLLEGDDILAGIVEEWSREGIKYLPFGVHFE